MKVCWEAARKRAEEEGREDQEELFRSMAKRGQQANLSFFAFTATPKHKTLAVFGRDREPAHCYTMRQAIEEGFILDVLKHYTTYADLLQTCLRPAKTIQTSSGRKRRGRWLAFCDCTLTTSRRRPR